MKKITTMLLSLLLALGMSLGSMSICQADTDAATLEGELLYYYQKGSETDVLRTLDALQKVDQSAYTLYKNIIDQWDYIDNDMVEYVDVAQDGLPTDKTLAFVVLGYQLDNDGNMQDELKGRCDVAVASANKYPNAYIFCSGGATSKGGSTNTEAGLMKDYMVSKGIDASRIITEETATTTVENAKNTFTMLPNYGVTSIDIISSQYHLKRGTLLYYAESQKLESSIKIVGNVGWVRSDKSTEGIDMEASSLAQLLGVTLPGGHARPGETPTAAPDISILQSLALSGATTYTKGDNLSLVATATYDIDNYQRNVTSLATITGYDANKIGSQTVTASYTENGVTKTASIQIEVKEATSTVVSPTTNSASTTTSSSPAVSTGDDLSFTAYIYTLIVSFIGAIFVVRKKVMN
ncbi:MAG: YdcF family protein [Thomasclavelia sp.]|jgi:vancomycin permeability regulator SanA|nr:YdcF family protein [Thomasclavelia sp.]